MNEFDQDRQLLEAIIEYSGTTASDVAKKTGVSSSTFYRPLNGTATTKLGRSTLKKLRDAYPNFPGWDANDIVTDRQLSFRHDGTDQETGTVKIAQIDLSFGLGGSVMDEEITDSQLELRSFPLEWVRMFTDSPASQLCWARGQGNSMEPLIGDGDVILIDRSQRDLRIGDLCWAISYGQLGMIKRLRPMPDGGVKILSDNPNVPPETAYDGELNVFGRVIVVAKRI